jgi:four helix bundle protein
MIHKNFRAYQLAVAHYKLCDRLKCASHLKTQLVRAASSICLNLAEGSGRPCDRDRMRFYGIALSSLREVQSILDLVPHTPASLLSASDQLGACVYRLNNPKQSQ